MGIEEKIAEILKANCGKIWCAYENMEDKEAMTITHEILTLLKQSGYVHLDEVKKEYTLISKKPPHDVDEYYKD